MPKITNDTKISEDKITEISQGNTLIKLLGLQLGIINNVDEIENYIEDDIQRASSEVKQEYTIATGVDYSTIGSNTKICGVNANNSSKFTLNQSELNQDLTIFKDRSKSKILIMHTHTSESYTSSPEYTYEQTGNFRTQDSNYNVVRVGNELKGLLENKGFNIIHDETYHDYPAYSGSYDRSLETVKNILGNEENIDIVFDIHRDAVSNNSGFRPIIEIQGKTAAQIMFVVGTNGGGLSHPDWKENLKLAIKIQKKADELYPGLFRPMIIRNSRYNQHLTRGSLIIEVGATGNTLDDCLVSMEFLANVLEAVL